MKFLPYSGYKPSGVEWLGEVPEHWQPISLKWISDRYAGGTPDRSNDAYWDDGTIPWINSGAVNQFLITEPSAFITEEGYRNSSARYVPEGALVMALAGQGKTKGMVAQTAIRTTCNQSMAAIVPDESTTARYLYWLLDSQYEHIRNMAGGEARDGLNLDILGSIPCFKVPSEEQLAIADFLDRETAKLDTLVEKKRALIEKLKEKRAALISRTVTRGLPPDAARAAGLNPHPKLKPSGIEWLGDVLDHWEIVRLRFLVERIIDTEHKTVEFDPDGEYLVARTPNIRDGKLVLEEAKYTNEEGFREWTRRGEPRVGDILFTREAPAGEACIVPKLPKLCLGQRVVNLQLRQDSMNSSFAIYSIYGGLAHEFIAGLSAGSTVPHFNMSDISSIPFLVPPLIEQRTIADYLDHETAKIDRMAEKVEAAIERLREYRSALITAAVTGKIDVRALSPGPSPARAGEGG